MKQNKRHRDFTWFGTKPTSTGCLGKGVSTMMSLFTISHNLSFSLYNGVLSSSLSLDAGAFLSSSWRKWRLPLSNLAQSPNRPKIHQSVSLPPFYLFFPANLKSHLLFLSPDTLHQITHFVSPTLLTPPPPSPSLSPLFTVHILSSNDIPISHIAPSS